ncbi:MAG: sigma-70 family RNA polymerase sigma factor [Chloroflexota bacterium]
MTKDVLIQAAVRGSPVAWRQLVEQHFSMITSLVARRVQNYDEAQDIAQETFLQCYLQLSKLNDPTKFAPWLKQIAINICRDRYRRNRDDWVPLYDDDQTGLIKEDQLMLRPLPSALTVAAKRDEDSIDLDRTIKQALDMLPKKLRITAELYFLKQLRYQEIAEHLDTPLGTVKRRLYEARQRLKTEVSQIMSTQTDTRVALLKEAVGLETTGEQHTPIFSRGLHLPTACTLNFSTAMDNQEALTIHVLQGDSQQMAACRSIAKLDIQNIAPQQKQGEPQISVTFEISASGQLTCKANEAKDRLITRGNSANIAVNHIPV